MIDAVPLCGPSKFIFNMFVKFTVWGHKLSPMKNRFPNNTTESYKEIVDLQEMHVLGVTN